LRCIDNEKNRDRSKNPVWLLKQMLSQYQRVFKSVSLHKKGLSYHRKASQRLSKVYRRDLQGFENLGGLWLFTNTESEVYQLKCCFLVTYEFYKM